MSIMKITVLYFASLADKAQKSQETLTLDDNTDIPTLYNQLQNTYNFTLDAEQLRVAINDEFADWQDSLNDGDVVVFIPPVAGG